MEKLKLIIGFILLPVAYLIFILDRIISIMAPQYNHPKFNDWLTNENVLIAIVRILSLAVVRWFIYVVFNI